MVIRRDDEKIKRKGTSMSVVKTLHMTHDIHETPNFSYVFENRVTKVTHDSFTTIVSDGFLIKDLFCHFPYVSMTR